MVVIADLKYLQVSQDELHLGLDLVNLHLVAVKDVHGLLVGLGQPGLAWSIRHRLQNPPSFLQLSHGLLMIIFLPLQISSNGLNIRLNFGNVKNSVRKCQSI